MSRWNLWITQMLKWNLSIIESYITFMAATILFQVFFDTVFSLSVFEIWLIYFLLSIPTMVPLKEKQGLFYFTAAGVFFLGWLFLQLSVFPWIFTLIFILWRTLSLETLKDDIYEDYLVRVLFYIVMVFSYYLTHSFYHFSNTQTIYYSFVGVVLSFLLGGMLLQLKKAPLHKNLLLSFMIQFVFIITGIGSLFFSFLLLKKPLLYLILNIKEGIGTILYWIGYWLFQGSNHVEVHEDVLDFFYEKYLQPEVNQQESIQIPFREYHTPFFVKMLGYLGVGIVLIGVIFIAIRLIKKITASKEEAQAFVHEGDGIEAIKNKKRRRRIVSSSFYRRLYQNYLIWLVKKKKMDYSLADTSQSIQHKIVSTYPELSPEIERVTKIYQQARYSDQIPDMTKGEFRGILQHLKKMIKSHG